MHKKASLVEKDVKKTRYELNYFACLLEMFS